MHPEDRSKLAEIDASYDALLRKYGEIMGQIEGIVRRVAVVEETAVDHARKLDGLLQKVTSTYDRVNEINKRVPPRQ